MRLESLRVIHLRKSAASSAEVGARLQAELSGAFMLDSCQRWLWVTHESQLSAGLSSGLAPAQVLVGADAYLFLLRVATGLESQIVGETDIFGQLKEAWKNAERSGSLHPSLASKLGPWMQRLFEDTKEIRSRYLQNLGGASYGSLVRMMIKSQAHASRQPVLLVGAGQIAQAVAPYLLDYEIWILNRSTERAEALRRELELRPGARVRVLEPGEESMGWREAAHAVVCIPVDGACDGERLAAWQAGERKGLAKGSLIHLGGLKKNCGIWAEAPGFQALDDLFALQKTQCEVRSFQIAQAGKACEERAKLRALGTSVSIPHGWEDLAVFA